MNTKRAYIVTFSLLCWGQKEERGKMAPSATASHFCCRCLTDKIKMSVMITVWVHTLPVYPLSDALTELLVYFHCCTVSCFHNYVCVYHGEINTSSCCFIISLRGS